MLGPSRSAYLQYLIDAVLQEVASEARNLTVPIEHRRELDLGDGCFLALDLYLRFVPADILAHEAAVIVERI